MSALLSATYPWLQQRGYSLLYRPGESSRCPCCGRKQWIVGRLMAECAHCEAALPLDQVHGIGSVARFVRSHAAENALPSPHPAAA